MILVLQMCIWIYALDHLGQSRLETNKAYIGTRSRLFTTDSENDQTHVTLLDNLGRFVTPLSGHTTTLNNIAASPNK
jgi:hypothetical protein